MSEALIVPILVALGGVMKHLIPTDKINKYIPWINVVFAAIMRGLAPEADAEVTSTAATSGVIFAFFGAGIFKTILAAAFDSALATGLHQLGRKVPLLNKIEVRGKGI